MRRNLPLLFLLLLALGFRIWAGAGIYPVMNDAGHFVQHAVAITNKGWMQMSQHWSQFNIAAGVLGLAAGLDAGGAMKLLTLVCGVAVVGLVWFIARAVAGPGAGLLAGVLAAGNKSLVEFSQNGMGEMPYLACLLGALALCLPALLRREVPPGRCLAAAALLGVGIYARPTEAMVSLALLAGFCGLVCVSTGRWRRLWIPAAMALCFAACMSPLMIFTRATSGAYSPGTKLVNIAFGEIGYDSKRVKSEGQELAAEVAKLRQLGSARYIWENKGRMLRRIPSNFAIALRSLNEQVFAGPFRLGFAWFALLTGAALILHLRRGGGAASLLLPALVFTMPLLLSLSFVVDRWLVPSIPFFLVLVAAAFWPRAAEEAPPRTGLRVLLSALAALMALSGTALAREKLRDDGWHIRNMAAAGEELRKHGTEDDVLLASGPYLAIHFYRHDPLRYRDLPYFDTPEGLAAFCQANRITLLAVSSLQYPSWPLHDWVADGLLPAAFEPLGKMAFTQPDFRYGERSETIVFYRFHRAAK